MTKPRSRVFTTKLRVRYAETDQMGVVYHGNYFAWFEMGRVELLRELGLTYRELEAHDGCNLPVAEVTCRYRLPARYDDELTVETRVVAARGALVKFGYRLLRVDAEGEAVLAEALTTHVVVDRSLRRCPMPERYAAALRQSMEMIEI